MSKLTDNDWKKVVATLNEMRELSDKLYNKIDYLDKIYLKAKDILNNDVDNNIDPDFKDDFKFYIEEGEYDNASHDIVDLVERDLPSLIEFMKRYIKPLCK